MQVDVVDDSGARDPAEVPAEVEALRAHALGERAETRGGQPVDLHGLVGGYLAELSLVPVGSDHEVACRVGVSVEQDEGVLAAVNDEAVLVPGLGGAAEDAPFLLVRVLDVLEPPRGPESLQSQCFQRKNATAERKRHPITLTAMTKPAEWKLKFIPKIPEIRVSGRKITVKTVRS